MRGVVCGRRDTRSTWSHGRVCFVLARSRRDDSGRDVLMETHTNTKMCVNKSDSSSHVSGLILVGRTAKRKKNKLETLYIKVQMKQDP